VKGGYLKKLLRRKLYDTIRKRDGMRGLGNVEKMLR